MNAVSIVAFSFGRDTETISITQTIINQIACLLKYVFFNSCVSEFSNLDA